MRNFTDRLNQAVTLSITEIQGALGNWRPTRLERAVIEMQKQSGESPIDFRHGDWFDASLGRYVAGGIDALSSFDQLVLAYRLSQPNPRLLGRCLLTDPGTLVPAWRAWSYRCSRSDDSIAVLIWRGVLISVFEAGQEEPGLPQARKFLADTWPLVRARKPVSDWMAALERHQGLFGREPVGRYITEWLDGNRTGTDELRVAVQIPETSWFWTSLISSVVDCVCTQSEDSRFRSQLSVALDLREEHKKLHSDVADNILVRVLDRYASCSVPSRHDRLLADALSAWGSPQLNLASAEHRWSRTSEAARRMICGWLAEEDLQDFDELCRRAQQVDGRRLTYWLRFKNQITYSRLVLGDDMRNSRDPDIERFRERKKGRLAWLTPQPSPLNNAIILRIGEWWFVEFSETGNACYPYKADRVQIKFGKAKHGLGELKSTAAVHASGATTLIHQNRDWEGVFDRFLAARGILPDERAGASASRPAVPRLPPAAPASPARPARPARPAPATPAKRPAPTPNPQFKVPDKLKLPTGVVSLLADLGAQLVDYRGRQGRLWIEVENPPESLQAMMRIYDFKYADPRGFYYTK